VVSRGLAALSHDIHSVGPNTSDADSKEDILEDQRFDVIVRSLITSPSRRRFLGGLAAALGLLAPWASGTVEARKKKKKRKQKLERNAFGCVDVGQPCRGNDANCCSGHCEGTAPKKGKKDTSTCVDHNVGGCPAGADACVVGKVPCELDGVCFRTTGNASFCGKDLECTACSTDKDCEEAGFGSGAACIVCAVTCDKDGGTACVAAATPAES
jgi:hypothetical protein